MTYNTKLDYNCYPSRKGDRTLFIINEQGCKSDYDSHYGGWMTDLPNASCNREGRLDMTSWILRS